MSKSIILSSKGLKNINDERSKEFHFLFGDQDIKMKTLYAEFISPKVSVLHKSDPTIDSIIIYDQNQSGSNQITDEVLSLFQKLANGDEINLTKEQSIAMLFISKLIQNEELARMIHEIYPLEIKEGNLDAVVSYLTLNHKQEEGKELSEIIDLISNNFDSVDHNKLLQLPKSILYSIIRSEKLKLENEDSLFDFIQKIFKFNDDDDFDKNLFLETIEFTELSKNKFIEFIEEFDESTMTKELWKKLCKCFYFIQNTKSENQFKYNGHLFEYDGNVDHCFNGIIHYLTKESGGNVNDNGTVKVTSSSVNSNFFPKNSVDLENEENYFQTKNEQNSWLKYDFGDRKVCPSHYTIRSRPNDGKINHHPKSWVIEGSNTDNDNDWQILDSRNDITVLEGAKLKHTFDIKNKKGSFRYLRIRQTGRNSYTYYHAFFFTFSALEYFGTLI